MSNEHEPEREDALGRLIARAGRRAEPPELLEAQVRAAVREEWQRVADRRRRRNYMIVAAAAMVAFAAVGIGVLNELPQSKAGEPVAQIVRAIGDVRLGSPAGTDRHIGSSPYTQAVRAGDVVVTGGRGGVNLTLGGEISVRIGPASRLQWLDQRRARLLSGTVYVDSPPLADSVPLAGKVSIETAYGRVTHVGTQYLMLVASGALTVRVREGLVMVEADTSREVARATEEIRIDSRGAVTRGRISPQGPAWGWVEALAAGFDVSNRSLLEFLDWVARETGRTLQFADERVREQARTTVLHGSTQGLSVGEALDSVMATTNLDAQAADGRLVVSQR